jgi:HemY protein
MIRALWYFVIIAALAAAAAWLADQPGSVSMVWGSYEIDTSFGVLAIAVGSIAVLAALLYRMWLFLRRAPGSIRGAWKNRRQDRGYRALTKGMVAVAAGDGQEARRQARRAEDLLNEPPLTMLLSAQAAQLNGDDRAAERFFRAMTDNSETEFLGLRGLLNQAIKRGDKDEALTITRRAHRLNADSDWVSENLFELQVQAAQWLDAHVTVKEAIRNKHLSPADGKRRQAVLTYQMSLEAARDGDKDRALEYARDSLSMDSDFVPATLSVAATLIGVGKARKAATMIERIWARSPHPDMVALYLDARGATEALERVKQVEKLRTSNLGHMESDLAVASEALSANLWGKARDHLMAAGGDNPPARVCRLLAELEEAEHGDLGKARGWLVKASMADPDPAWVCDNCGHTVTDWSAICGNCETFDRYIWRTPPHVMRQLVNQTEAGAAGGISEDGAPEPVLIPAPESRIDRDALPVVAEQEIKPPAPAEG